MVEGEGAEGCGEGAEGLECGDFRGLGIGVNLFLVDDDDDGAGWGVVFIWSSIVGELVAISRRAVVVMSPVPSTFVCAGLSDMGGVEQ